MKTEVKMQRELLGIKISQRSKSEFLSATDLFKAGNLQRVSEGLAPQVLNDYFKQKKTKEFIEELNKEYGQVKVASRGRKAQTWVHPILFMDMALWLSPKLKIKVYQWLQDNLLSYRNTSGDSYKKMCGAIYMNPNFNKSNFSQTIKTVANRVAVECGVLGEGKWEKATENQLKLRCKMQEYISFACDMTTDLETAINVGIKKAKEGWE